MEYPHWLIAAGAVLLMLGFVGLALRKRAVEGDLDDALTSGQGQSEPEAELAQTQDADRMMKEKGSLGRKVQRLRQGPEMTVLIYVDTNKQVGDQDHLMVFANADAAETWFEENDPEGVAFEYEVRE